MHSSAKEVIAFFFFFSFEELTKLEALNDQLKEISSKMPSKSELIRLVIEASKQNADSEE